MPLRDIIVWCVCIVLTASLLIAATAQLDYINRQREDLNLVIERPEDLPPSLAFATVATGAFRGLVVDILWMRADSLKEQKLFFDARQLAEWITKLQPRFAAVWEFHAWNMAYNISVAIPATMPDQRWRWVKNGYELLRDEAIDKYKLKNIELYRELARIFQHKIGGVADDAHKYYKIQFALEMEPLLGPADNKYFDALAEAPREWQEFTGDPNVAGLVEALKSSDEVFSNTDHFVSNYLSLRQDPNRFTPAAGRVIEDFPDKRILEKFDIFARAYILRKTWKLEPVTMRELNQTYGPIDWKDPNTHLPLDWRHPDSHAIYWAVKGLRIAEQEQSSNIEADRTNTDRMIGHSLQNLFRYGKIFVFNVAVEIPSDDPSQEAQIRIYPDIVLQPDLRMFEPYNKSQLAILEKYNTEKERGTYISLQDGHRNMLKNAVLSFYLSGHQTEAQKIYNQLRKLYPREEFKVPLLTFARRRLLEELETLGILDVREQIDLMLRESYYLYAIGDDDATFGREKMIEEVYKNYQSQQNLRLALPELNVLKTLALYAFFNDERYPLYLREALISRIKIERPELYKKLDAEREKLQKQAEQEQSQ